MPAASAHRSARALVLCGCVVAATLTAAAVAAAPPTPGGPRARSTPTARRPTPAPASSAAASGCPGPDEIVRKLQARYDTTRAFRARFRQETAVAAVGQRAEGAGKVAFKKPGKMRWDFEEPDQQTIISDGTTLWVYQPAERQVLRAPFGAAFVSTTPISFLTGVGRISEDFRVEPDPRGCDADHFYVRLLPRKTPDVGSLSLAATRGAFDIVGAQVTDPIGNVTTLTFTDVERNVELDDADFHFEVPAGVDVVDAPGAAPAP